MKGERGPEGDVGEAGLTGVPGLKGDTGPPGIGKHGTVNTDTNSYLDERYISVHKHIHKRIRKLECVPIFQSFILAQPTIFFRIFKVFSSTYQYMFQQLD